MGDYSRSQYWDNYEEDPDQNWKQEAMENAIRRYLSGPNSPLSRSPHPQLPILQHLMMILLLKISFLHRIFNLCLYIIKDLS
jgi:hypothetical protein